MSQSPQKLVNAYRKDSIGKKNHIENFMLLRTDKGWKSLYLQGWCCCNSTLVHVSYNFINYFSSFYINGYK